MRLYLDDDSIFSVLVRLLRQAGHDVLLPADLGIAGADDPVHLRNAIRENCVFLSHNYEDFKFLHELLRQGQGHHPGIFSRQPAREVYGELPGKERNRIRDSSTTAKWPLQSARLSRAVTIRLTAASGEGKASRNKIMPHVLGS